MLRPRLVVTPTAMPRIAKAILGVIAGLVVWIVVATLGNWLLRAAIEGYTAAEPTMQFTLAMQVGRLVVGAVSSLAAGAACASLTRATPAATVVLAIVLVLMFLPVHYRLWTQFPAWYHATFLISLAPLVLLGARLARRA
jgi:hypothetical protein